MKTMRIISIALLIMAIASFAGISISYGNLNDDNRYRDDSSSVFSPGYLNAAKSHAEAIVAQQAQPKNILQNMIERMQGNAENKVQQVENENTMITPKLQKKESSKSTASASSKAGTGRIVIDDKTRQAIIADFAKAIQKKAVGAGYGFNKMANTDANFDLSGNGTISSMDATYMSSINTLDDAQFAASFSRIMAEVEDRMGTAAGDYYYASIFDINKDGKIDFTDYDGVRQATGFGRTDLPDTAYYKTNTEVAYAGEASQVYMPDNYKFLGQDGFLSSSYGSDDYAKRSSLLSNLLKGKAGDTTDQTSALNVNDVKDPATNSLEGNPLVVPLTNNEDRSRDVETTMRFKNILQNPTEGQKGILEVLKALLADTEKIEKESNGQVKPELKKAQDDLLQAVANLLLAQNIPGLLKNGDITNIKGMFQELNNTKNKIMLEYAKSTKPYYDNMLKDMAKNMAVLQGRNLLNPNMTKDELDKLPPSELDKILEKIKNMKDKTFEEEYLLQQEAKYRKEYLDPSNKKLEEDMKDMMKNFTGRISDVLKSTEKK
jgi:hypothetical protein